MKGSLVCSLPLAVGVALLAAYQPMAAADATPVSLRYTFAPGQTNVYNLQIEAQGEAGREAITGTLLVSARAVGTNLIGLTLRGQLRPKSLGGMSSMMGGYRPGAPMPLSAYTYGYPGQTNDIGQTYPMRYQKTNHMDTNITSTAIFLDEQRLRIYLGSTNSRNFFFDGHGDANNIAGIPSSLLNATIIHRYRFVFLDACNTANGDLDKAFGINGPKRLGSDYYHKTGIRPAAFVGYTASVNYATGGPITVNGVQYDDTIPYQVPGFISNFLFYWDTDLMGYGLLSTIDNAKLYLPPVNGQYRENYLAIHGYYDLHIDEVNHRWDTW